MTTRSTRFGTGDDAFDAILGGGLPSRSVTVIAGEPGAGKTVVVLQLLFHQARQGKKILLFTTLSEPAIKLLHYMEAFEFFDEGLIGDRIVVADLGSTLHDEGVEAALAAIGERVAREEPDIVVIDSFKALHDFTADPVTARSVSYRLSVELASWGATTLLVGEYTREEIGTRPEFAIADGIVRLMNDREGLTAVRAVEVTKLRGSDPITGLHFFEITAGGARFYPRVRMPQSGLVGELQVGDRVSTGVPGLDELLHGGVPRGSATLVEGGTGTGKTLLGLHFLVTGALAGEPGILFTLEESPDQIRGVAMGFGIDLARLEADGMLEIAYASPVELSTDRFLSRARARVEELGARRVVLDSLTSLGMGLASDRRFRELVYAITRHFRAAGATLWTTMEVQSLIGSPNLTGYGILSTADNIIILRYVEVDGRLERAVSVLKARGTAHDTELRQATIGSGGFRVDGPFTDIQGVLTGRPVRSPRPSS